MSIQILIGDVRERLKDLPDDSVHCVVTSPPYFGLRDYGHPGQIGLEPTPEEFVQTMVEVFREVRRVLRSDGTFWLNLGDSYNAHPGQRKVTDKAGAKQESKRGSTGAPSRSVEWLKPKDLIGIPWRVAFALQDDGWYLRSSIIWHKPNPMPESVTDRPTSAHENIFLFAKSERYFYDHEAVKEPVSVPDWDNGTRVFGGKNKHGANVAHGDRTTGRLATRARELDANARPPSSRPHTGLTAADEREAQTRNLRNVWTVATQPFSEAHFATFPPSLIEPCIKAGCPVGGTVLDPFGGAGTTGLVADRLGRNAVLIELNPEYAAMAERRISRDAGMFSTVTLAAAE